MYNRKYEGIAFFIIHLVKSLAHRESEKAFIIVLCLENMNHD